ncbi:hypothetical protein [Desulfovibrio inopinatus]|uniref:hypothetical protein n=1 Tax=Desulfovibrio inopinatus TaxID=102109 RepID=UPI00040C1809|nr:hypothetical protein [Desulfovibrio inopinatus]
MAVIPGTDIHVWFIRPTAVGRTPECVLTCRFPVAVHQAKNRLEQRRPLTIRPLWSYRFSVAGAPFDLPLMSGLELAQNVRVAVPVCSESYDLVSFSTTTMQISPEGRGALSTAMYCFFADTYDLNAYELAEITNISGSMLTVSGTSATWDPARSVIYPALVGTATGWSGNTKAAWSIEGSMTVEEEFAR